MKIGALLLQLLPRGETISECPVSTAGGVRAVDVAWLAPDRAETGQDPIVFVRAPDICIEILSPSNTASEIDEKRALYFDAGTSAGREAAQKRGVRFGRPRKLSIDQEQLARRLVLEGKAVSDVARTFNVHAATIYRLADADSSDFQIAIHS
jgi:hypothetical protein